MFFLFFITSCYANEIYLSGNINLELVPKIYHTEIPKDIELIERDHCIILRVKEKSIKKKLYKVTIATDQVKKVSSFNLNKINLYQDYPELIVTGFGDLTLENYQQQSHLIVNYNGTVNIKNSKNIKNLHTITKGTLKINNTSEIIFLTMEIAGLNRIIGNIKKLYIKGNGVVYIDKFETINEREFTGYIRIKNNKKQNLTT